MFARDERAAAMVEAAIVLPVLMLFLFGILDLGRALFLYNNLQDTARRASRLAAVQGPNPCSSAQGLVKDSVAAWVREFNNNPQSAATVRGLVSIACDLAADGVTATNVKVTISNYPFATITPMPRLGGTQASWTITRSAYARSEYAPDGS